MCVAYHMTLNTVTRIIEQRGVGGNPDGAVCPSQWQYLTVTCYLKASVGQQLQNQWLH